MDWIDDVPRDHKGLFLKLQRLPGGLHLLICGCNNGLKKGNIICGGNGGCRYLYDTLYVYLRWLETYGAKWVVEVQMWKWLQVGNWGNAQLRRRREGFALIPLLIQPTFVSRFTSSPTFQLLIQIQVGSLLPRLKFRPLRPGNSREISNNSHLKTHINPHRAISA